MQQAVGLLFDSLDHPGMTMPRGANSDAGGKIQKYIAVHVVDPKAFGFFNHQRIITRIGRRDVFPILIDQFACFWAGQGLLDQRCFYHNASVEEKCAGSPDALIPIVVDEFSASSNLLNPPGAIENF